MNIFPKISIVTPSYNDAPYLETTILSILSQNYPNLEYIVIDGGSTDGSTDIIRKYETKLAYWVSEKDNGMYHAIQKGFEKSTGEVMGWINSDDKHHPGSLSILGEIFGKFRNVHWVQGVPNVIDDNDRIVFAENRPGMDKLFFYKGEHLRTGNYIQQESTFWSRSLWDRAGAHVSRDYKFAGDFELWIRFFQFERLNNLNALLGTFRMSGKHQASINNYDQYKSECALILQKYPIPEAELQLQKRQRFFDRCEYYLLAFVRRIRKTFRGGAESTYGRIYFDAKDQEFKIN